jgi:hypothetical protein
MAVQDISKAATPAESRVNPVACWAYGLAMTSHEDLWTGLEGESLGYPPCECMGLRRRSKRVMPFWRGPWGRASRACENRRASPVIRERNHKMLTRISWSGWVPSTIGSMEADPGKGEGASPFVAGARANRPAGNFQGVVGACVYWGESRRAPARP